ncbi:glycosyltransferase family 2 protein, partial [Streptomyces sp. TRM64462]|uniref:glycosyltransferase family 2 protein n=1 Tax=Streptomyces sp. TRM64462 TaxID=2741726 RepID=UPI001586C458
MTSTSRTTVVVITRDRCDQLLHTLDRLAALPERPPVIVVDNGSGDGTPEAVARRHPGVTLLMPGRNLGAVGRTLGVRRARTPYVAFSDDDSWWEPGALAAAERLLDAHPRLGLIAARVRVGDGGRTDPLNDELAASPLGRPAGLPGRRVLGFLACAAVARRSAYLEAGGYHPVLFFGGEETLLAYDLAACGWGVAHCPEVVAVHRPVGGVRDGRRAVMRRNAAL